MNNKIKLDYVFSGTSMMRLLHAKKYDDKPEYLEQRYNIMKRGVEFITQHLNETSNMFSITNSVLYNAYVEPGHGKFYNERDIGFSNLYADSGGLQVITQGKSLTDQLKTEIYNNQDLSDVSFCFDEIPVERKNESTVSGGNGERSNVSAKQFNYSRFKDCAKKTAENVLNQLNSLQKSQVSYIVQGNTINDMVEWFTIAADVLGPDNVKKLKGIALADTCMGNGMLESCDMMLAAKIIFDNNPQLNKHIHLLGVGSVSRMLPAIMMVASGLIDSDTTISFDSSSNSMIFVMGKVSFMDLTKKPRYNVELESYKEYFEFMRPVYEPYCNNYNIDELAQYLYQNNKQFSAPEYNADNIDHVYHGIARCFVPLYCIWCNIGFFNNLELMCNKRTKKYDRLFELLSVKSVNDYYKWRSAHGHKINSTRMHRKREIDLTSIFGD